VVFQIFRREDGELRGPALNDGLSFPATELELGQRLPGLGWRGGTFEREPADLFDTGMRVFECDLRVIPAVTDPKSAKRTLAFIVDSLVTY
jgi:hypothetical protein